MLQFFLIILFVIESLSASSSSSFPFHVPGKVVNVSFDARSWLFNGEAVMLMGGSAHPSRIMAGEWSKLFQQYRAANLNLVQLYVMHSKHQPLRRSDPVERLDVIAEFIKQAGEHGLFVHLRPGIYVCAEFSYGGLAPWIGFERGMRFRAFNQPWMSVMEAWFDAVVSRLAPLFSPRGGPIVLMQVENELGYGGGPVDSRYVDWSGQMAASVLQKHGLASVPVTMCNGANAPSTVLTCDGLSCTAFAELHGSSNQRPLVWTEVEQGMQTWFDSPQNPTTYFWGSSVAALAFNLVQWFARGGCHTNYYMMRGGANFGPNAGSGIIQAYSADAPVCPDGLAHEPKLSHLTQLHTVIAGVAADLLSSPKQVKGEPVPGGCTRFQYGNVQFIENANDTPTACPVDSGFGSGLHYHFPKQSAVILDDQRILYNSSSFNGNHVPVYSYVDAEQREAIDFTNVQVYVEPIAVAADQYPAIQSDVGPMEQSLAAHRIGQRLPQQPQQSRNKVLEKIIQYSEFMLYETVTEIPGSIITHPGSIITITTRTRVAHCLNDSHENKRPTMQLQCPITSVPSWCRGGQQQKIRISLISFAEGFQNYPMESNSTRFQRGILNRSIAVNGHPIGVGSVWTMRAGLTGELGPALGGGGGGHDPVPIRWIKFNSTVQSPAWFRFSVRLPAEATVGDDNGVYLLDLNGLAAQSRGKLFFNGFPLGTYALRRRNSQTPTQRFYHIPSSLFVTTNELVLLEIGRPDTTSVQKDLQIKLVRRTLEADHSKSTPDEQLLKMDSCSI